jgi:HEAT repeat protein
VNDEQWVVRNAAAEALEAKANLVRRAPGKLKTPHETPWLIEFAAKHGMGVSPGAAATDIFLLALKSEEVEYRLAALPYLKFTPSEGVLAQLYDAMYKDDPDLREAAYYTLWEMGVAGIKLPNPKQYGFD